MNTITDITAFIFLSLLVSISGLVLLSANAQLSLPSTQAVVLNIIPGT